MNSSQFPIDALILWDSIIEDPADTQTINYVVKLVKPTRDGYEVRHGIVSPTVKTASGEVFMGTLDEGGRMFSVPGQFAAYVDYRAPLEQFPTEFVL